MPEIRYISSADIRDRERMTTSAAP